MKKYADLQDELLCERVFDVASSRARIPRQYEFQQADEIDQSGVCVLLLLRSRLSSSAT